MWKKSQPDLDKICNDLRKLDRKVFELDYNQNLNSGRITSNSCRCDMLADRIDALYEYLDVKFEVVPEKRICVKKK